jgi:hypothetical protein
MGGPVEWVDAYHEGIVEGWHKALEQLKEHARPEAVPGYPGEVVSVQLIEDMIEEGP